MVKEEPYTSDIAKFRADPTEYMKEEVQVEKPTTKPHKLKKVAFDPEDEGVDDATGFVSVGRDGKALSYTPESILKSMLFLQLI
jgi:translation initiation factor 3 subunit C